MNLEEAFVILEIFPTSNQEVVKDAHKKMILQFHTDKETGNHSKAAEINNAKDEIIKYITNMENNVALIKQVFDLAKIENRQFDNYRSQSDSLVISVGRKITSNIRNAQNKNKVLALISGVMTLVTGVILAVLKQFDKSNIILPLTFAGITAIIGIYSLFLKFKLEKIQDDFNYFKDVLNDKANLIDIINAIIKDTDKKSFTRNEFEFLCDKLRFYSIEELDDYDKSTEPLFRQFVRTIGASDYARLLVSKSLEKGILEEQMVQGQNGITSVGYKLLY